MKSILLTSIVLLMSQTSFSQTSEVAIKPLASVCTTAVRSSESTFLGTFQVSSGYRDNLPMIAQARCAANGGSQVIESGASYADYTNGIKAFVTSYDCFGTRYSAGNLCVSIAECRLANTLAENIASIEYWNKQYKCDQDVRAD